MAVPRRGGARARSSCVGDDAQALAAFVAELGHGPRMVERHAERARDGAARIAHHRDEALLVYTLVLRPRVHHCTVIDAVDDDLVDAQRLQALCLLKVARHLPREASKGDWW